MQKKIMASMLSCLIFMPHICAQDTVLQKNTETSSKTLTTNKSSLALKIIGKFIAPITLGVTILSFGGVAYYKYNHRKIFIRGSITSQTAEKIIKTLNDLSNRKIEYELIFENMEMVDGATFADVKFNGSIIFRGSCNIGTKTFKNVHFNRPVTIENAEQINGTFVGAFFDDDISVSGVKKSPTCLAGAGGFITPGKKYKIFDELMVCDETNVRYTNEKLNRYFEPNESQHKK